MSGSIRIGTIRGIPIRIHVTFLVVLPLLAWGFGRVFSEAARLAGIPPSELRGAPVLWGLVVALALFLSVLVHELAHSLYALRKGGRVRDITLLMIGGVSQISEPPRTGRQEAIMALVGPLTSLALGVVFAAAARAVRGSPFFDLRFVLGAFNLLPAFPMDGGRVLRGFLADRMGLPRATRIAAGLGKAFAIAFAVLAFFSANLLLMVVAFFVYVGAESESRGVLVKAFLGEIRVKDLVRSRPEPVDAFTSLYDLGERMLRERRLAYPVAEGGRVVGVATLEDVRKVPLEERGRMTVGEVARRVQPLQARDHATEAMRALAEAGLPVLPVVDGAAPAGVLGRQDLARGLQLVELEATQHPPGPPAQARGPLGAEGRA